MSQETLANAARVSRSMLKDFENEKRQPQIHTLEAIVTVLTKNGIEFAASGEKVGVFFDPKV